MSKLIVKIEQKLIPDHADKEQQPEVKVPNKGTSKLITAECIQNWSETFVVDKGREDFCSETLLLDTNQILKEGIPLGVSKHSIVQTERNLNYTMTEGWQGHRTLTLASSKQTWKESKVLLELLQESAEVITIQQNVQQGQLFQVTRFFDSTLLLDEGNKCFNFVKSYGFVHEQQIALQDESLNEEAMYQKLYHSTVKHDKPVKGNAKSESQTMNATFGKRNDFDFKVNLAEETIPSQRNVWNH